MNTETRNKLIISSTIAMLVFGLTSSALVRGDQKKLQEEKPVIRKLASKNKNKTQAAKKAKAVQLPESAAKLKVAVKPASTPKTLRRISRKLAANPTRPVYSSRGSVRRTAPAPVPKPVVNAAAKASTVSAVFSGKASWYSFSRNHGMFAAMRGYRGKRVRVTGPKGTIIVTINDYGPQKYTGKIIDLSAEAFKAAIGPLSKGVGSVKIEILN